MGADYRVDLAQAISWKQEVDSILRELDALFDDADKLMNNTEDNDPIQVAIRIMAEKLKQAGQISRTSSNQITTSLDQVIETIKARMEAEAQLVKESVDQIGFE